MDFSVYSLSSVSFFFPSYVYAFLLDAHTLKTMFSWRIDFFINLSIDIDIKIYHYLYIDMQINVDTYIDIYITIYL